MICPNVVHESSDKIIKILKARCFWYTYTSKHLRSSVEIIWDKVFKSGPSKICGRLPWKMPGPLFNTLSHLTIYSMQRRIHNPVRHLNSILEAWLASKCTFSMMEITGENRKIVRNYQLMHLSKCRTRGR